MHYRQNILAKIAMHRRSPARTLVGLACSALKPRMRTKMKEIFCCVAKRTKEDRGEEGKYVIYARKSTKSTILRLNTVHQCTGSNKLWLHSLCCKTYCILICFLHFECGKTERKREKQMETSLQTVSLWYFSTLCSALLCLDEWERRYQPFGYRHFQAKCILFVFMNYLRDLIKITVAIIDMDSSVGRSARLIFKLNSMNTKRLCKSIDISHWKMNFVPFSHIFFFT